MAGWLSGANSQRALARWGRDVGLRRRQVGFRRRRSLSLATMHRVLHWVEVLALAGRDRGRRRDAAGARRLGAEGAYLLSAYGQQGGLVLGEVAVSDATNEPGVVAALLAGPPPAGETVTFEALFTRWAVAE